MAQVHTPQPTPPCLSQSTPLGPQRKSDHRYSWIQVLCASHGLALVLGIIVAVLRWNLFTVVMAALILAVTVQKVAASVDARLHRASESDRVFRLPPSPLAIASHHDKTPPGIDVEYAYRPYG